jgi:Rrf2 family cysteine metabolism transcriptional repressor
MAAIFWSNRPNQVSVGDVLRFLSRDQSPTDCIACVSKTSCPFDGRCAFSSMWIRVKQAAFNIYDKTSFQDLIDREHDAGWIGEQ